MSFDLSCIIIGHREGRLAVPSLQSYQAAVDTARAAGYTVETRLCLDRPDDLTRALFEAYRGDAPPVLEYDFGDQGKVRNAAIGPSETGVQGHYTAFLDADDLWSADWLVQGLAFLKTMPDTHIAHPAYNYFFEQQATIFCHIDQEDPRFRPDLLRVVNYWDALCICPTAIYRECPFCERDIDGGYAFEDWVWNLETVARGKMHKVVPDTVLFKRRQATSQTIRAGQSNSLGRPTPLSRYNHPFFAGPDTSQTTG